MDHVIDSRWRVLPIGRPETLRRAATEAALFGLAGLAGLFAVAVVIGVVIEEAFAETETGITADLVLRASLGGVLLFGMIGLLTLGALGALQGPLTARELAAAARRDTPATQVPIPDQWEGATESSAGAYKLLALWVLAILGLVYLVLVFVTLGDPDPTGLALLVGGGLLLAAIWCGIPLTKRVLEPRQMAIAAELEHRWTQAHREVADERELSEQDVSEARTRAGLTGRLPGRGVRTLNDLLILFVVVGVATWGIATHVTAAIAYPDRTYGPGRQLDDRASLDPADERLVDLIAVGGAIGAAVGMLAFVCMVVCEVIIWSVERRELRRALADGAAAPPPYLLLRRAMVSACPPALRLVFALAGATLALGFALWFVTLVADRPDWDTYAAAGQQLRDAGSLGPWIMLGALVVMGLGVALGSQLDTRDQALRDQLVQRWPVRSAEQELETDGEEAATGDAGPDARDGATPDAAGGTSV
ncbi:hypothetical protein ASG73_02705 [Janibacter sp. Soil728]|uniref:hypothetical protein n=1 Tax=Janibacter sp. Soil728 TaxID=1736393 RepID=UPI0006FFD725|nr:hypothetical protein [Janibacter sp. Soil728]KRE39265.1 hypothetical protein ASG73_02705 [Janibacter sp. Soil728]